MPWKRITKEVYYSIKKAHGGKLKTIEYKEWSQIGDAYFLWVQGLEADKPLIKMEVVYSDFQDPVKFSIYANQEPTEDTEKI
jgi:hypothetical protein